MAPRHQDPTNATKFINITIRDLGCTVTPGDTRVVRKGEIVPTPRDIKYGLTADFFRNFCAPGWLSVYREPARAPAPPKPPAAKKVEAIPADVEAAIEAYGKEFKENIDTLKVSYFSTTPRMTVADIHLVTRKRRAADATKDGEGGDEGDGEKDKDAEGSGEGEDDKTGETQESGEGSKDAEGAQDGQETDDPAAVEAKFRENLKTWAQENGIGDVAEYIDSASMETLREVEGKTPDEVRALLDPNEGEQDPGQSEPGDSASDVPDTHVLDPYHEGEGEAKQVHKKAFNQYIRKTYPDKDLDEARASAGLSPAKK